MSRKFAIVEIDLTTKDCKHVGLHVLYMSDMTEKGFYRQTVSYDAFFNGIPKKGKQHGPNWKMKERLYVAKWWDEFESDCERWKKYGSTHDDRTLPTVEHQSIWEFYEHIGYDYKKKRWVKKCPDCNGSGRIESVAYYYGVVECSACDGSGVR